MGLERSLKSRIKIAEKRLIPRGWKLPDDTPADALDRWLDGVFRGQDPVRARLAADARNAMRAVIRLNWGAIQCPDRLIEIVARLRLRSSGAILRADPDADLPAVDDATVANLLKRAGFKSP